MQTRHGRTCADWHVVVKDSVFVQKTRDSCMRGTSTAPGGRLPSHPPVFVTRQADMTELQVGSRLSRFGYPDHHEDEQHPSFRVSQAGKVVYAEPDLYQSLRVPHPSMVTPRHAPIPPSPAAHAFRHHNMHLAWCFFRSRGLQSKVTPL